MKKSSTSMAILAITVLLMLGGCSKQLPQQEQEPAEAPETTTPIMQEVPPQTEAPEPEKEQEIYNDNLDASFEELSQLE
ncbi:hypothetical protein HYU18_03535 [Candidatus Woesearchaeota archaeon]|nr:hypothetical protein [Candidatus Woesearchaeota archaeon]